MDMLLYFVVGGLLANSIPHITNGVSGRRFHTPFSSPPVRGSSSPLVNVLWGSANLAGAAAVYHLAIAREVGERIPMGVVGAGFVVTLIGLSLLFGRLDRDRG